MAQSLLKTAVNTRATAVNIVIARLETWLGRDIAYWLQTSAEDVSRGNLPKTDCWSIEASPAMTTMGAATPLMRSLFQHPLDIGVTVIVFPADARTVDNTIQPVTL